VYAGEDLGEVGSVVVVDGVGGRASRDVFVVEVLNCVSAYYRGQNTRDSLFWSVLRSHVDRLPEEHR
jgi:hypothetical protein